jgi:hypothetical protein
MQILIEQNLKRRNFYVKVADRFRGYYENAGRCNR